jgi:hypothetical protein
MAWDAKRIWTVGERIHLGGAVYEVAGVGGAGQDRVLHLRDLAETETVLLVDLDERQEITAFDRQVLSTGDPAAEPDPRRVLATRLRSVLDVWSALLPARVAAEDLGDYLEDIHRRVAAGQRWLACFRLVVAVCWTTLNAIGYALTQLRRQKT